MGPKPTRRVLDLERVTFCKRASYNTTSYTNGSTKYKPSFSASGCTPCEHIEDNAHVSRGSYRIASGNHTQHHASHDERGSQTPPPGCGQ